MRRAPRLALLAAGLVGAVLAWCLLRPGPRHALVVEVPRGESITGVTRRLARAGLLPSATVARLWLAVAARGREPQWGTYRFPPGTTPVGALERVLSGRVELIRVTVPEGLTAEETAARFVAAGIGTREEWRHVVEDPTPVRGLAPEAATLEGFLFPDTYLFHPSTPAREAVRVMVGRFLEVWDQETRAGGPQWGSPFQIVTLASLVQAESSLPQELPHIAGVFLNRLRRGMLLQCDPTVVYALKRRGVWRGVLTRADLTIGDPYNTYRYPGLPPGPIDSPGRLALRAALAPAPTRDLYFVARPEGGHAFSRTLSQHLRAVARLRRARR